MDKKQLRTLIRDKRKTLSHTEQQSASKQLFQHFLNTNLYQSEEHFALYTAHQGEMDVKLISDFLFQQQKKCYLPVIPKGSEHVMHFVEVKQDEPLVANQYGILEPPTLHKTIAPKDLDVVFVPLVAVDKRGFRLGAGKGYYDATFAFKLNDKSSKPLLIGVAHSFQQLDEIPINDWDIKLDGLLTESLFLRF